MSSQSTIAPTKAHQVKRTRKSYACIPCHERKVRCDRKTPCTPCLAKSWAHLCTPQGQEQGQSQLHRQDRHSTFNESADFSEDDEADTRLLIERMQIQMNQMEETLARHLKSSDSSSRDNAASTHQQRSESSVYTSRIDMNDDVLDYGIEQAPSQSIEPDSSHSLSFYPLNAAAGANGGRGLQINKTRQLCNLLPSSLFTTLRLLDS